MNVEGERACKWVRIGEATPGPQRKPQETSVDTFRDPLSLADDLERIARSYDREARRLFDHERDEARQSAAACRQWASDLRAGIE